MKIRGYVIIQLLFWILLAPCSAQISPFQYSVNKAETFDKAAVSCAHPLASEAGAMVLKQGGNAVDAAIAMQWALAVVYPTAGNIGGGGFMVATLANGKTVALDYREMAPGKAKENMYVDAATGKANTRLSQSGHLASGVPGTPAGLFAAHQYAKLSMKKLIQPAIGRKRICDHRKRSQPIEWFANTIGTHQYHLAGVLQNHSLESRRHPGTKGTGQYTETHQGQRAGGLL
jgi:gamma-glutamyltranspeptidase/glutathione hydrolase